MPKCTVLQKPTKFGLYTTKAQPQFVGDLTQNKYTNTTHTVHAQANTYVYS